MGHYTWCFVPCKVFSHVHAISCLGVHANPFSHSIYLTRRRLDSSAAKKGVGWLPLIQWGIRNGLLTTRKRFFSHVHIQRLLATWSAQHGTAAHACNLLLANLAQAINCLGTQQLTTKPVLRSSCLRPSPSPGCLRCGDSSQDWWS
jgi:hypothetical protein